MQKKTKDILERKEDRGREELVMNFDAFHDNFYRNIYMLVIPKENAIDKYETIVLFVVWCQSHITTQDKPVHVNSPYKECTF